MGDRVKRFVYFRFNYYKNIEVKLEKMAQKGLFLEQIGSTFWTFKKDQPRKIKYTVTYFSEASIFNPMPTDNQQTYYEYAEEAGWHFAAEFNQMQIFWSEDDNPIPFETDDREKFENIKRCMRKNFLPSTIMLIVLFMFNLSMQYTSYIERPIDFLAEITHLYATLSMTSVVVYYLYMLVEYFIWCKRCERSLGRGSGCIEKQCKAQEIIDNIFMAYIFIILALLIISMFKNSNTIIVILGLIHIPLLMIVYRFTLKYCKKKQHSATYNKVVSLLLILGASLGYVFLLMWVITTFDLSDGPGKDYREVEWEIRPTESRVYKLYNDDMPLKAEDLYGDIDYDYYSYEATHDETIFLKRSYYRQSTLPDRNSPPEIEYKIFEPQFDFVYDIVAEDLRKKPEWFNDQIEPMDNAIFNTEEAYQFYNTEKEYTGKYLLYYNDKMILLELEEPVTEQQVTVILDKLVDVK